MVFNINCTDNCLHQDDGVCMLNHITSSSGDTSSKCPYFRDKEKSEEYKDKEKAFKLLDLW
ncbi:hypothetical protein [Gottschalkia acidurici]|uniref:hypothetical protein n=1 Tax=Clostridium acidurici TaxID=1556 RepID=UPI00059FF606|nr:hypothetical protein [Gottschalkia acidurici]